MRCFNSYQCLTKSILLFIGFLIGGEFAFAQEPDYHLITEAQYKQQTYTGDPGNLSQQYTFIGLYKQALIEEEARGHVWNLNPENERKVVNAKNAYPFIYDAIRKNRIVILNEAHNNPLSRVLFYNLIDSLENLGVNSLFIEAMGYEANDTSYENFKLVALRGYYQSENVFRQVMYKLKESKLHVYSYEYDPKSLDTLSDRGVHYIVSKTDARWVPIKVDKYVLDNFLSKGDHNREAHQALKIFQKLNRENIDKAFIYCGYGHAWRQGNNMIDILEHLLQQKVFAIDQTVMNECINRKLEQPLYTRFATADYPFVFVNDQNNPCFVLQSNTGTTKERNLVDLVVASPRSIYVNNRPSWLELNGTRKRYPLSKFMDLGLYTDFLVAIYSMDELNIKTEEQIPDDVIQVYGSGDNYDVILKPNQRYQFRVIKNKTVVMDKTIRTY
ncbi:MAG TPA: hypothetical protein VFF27_15890 [Bacteroidia bacterium]|jgi:hypothetical protein|nr:hypothetical protein [Bacteroidia bacterium]